MAQALAPAQELADPCGMAAVKKRRTSSAKTTSKTATRKKPAAKAAPAMPNIGKPATRALAAIGVVRLDQVTRYSVDELLDLHGVGPKAIRILREALGEKGKSFRKNERG
jgi:predicted flap endonuclease-1-like 5' DNA nuclease